MRTDGFAGLKASFEAIGVLIEAYWDDLYPIPDPEDGVTDSNLIIEERVLPLQRLAWSPRAYWYQGSYIYRLLRVAQTSATGCVIGEAAVNL